MSVKLATVSRDTVEIWSLETASTETSYHQHSHYSPKSISELHCIGWNHSNQVIAISGSNSNIDLIQVENGQLLSKLSSSQLNLAGNSLSNEIHLKPVQFSHNSRHLAVGISSSIELWDLKKRQIKHTFVLKNERDGVNSLKFLPNDRIISGSSSGKLHCWDAQTLQLVREMTDVDQFGYSTHGSIICHDISPVNPLFLASGFSDGTLGSWDYEVGKMIRNVNIHTGKVSSLSFSPKNSRLVITAGSIDGKIALVDLGSKKSNENTSAVVEVGTGLVSVSFHEDAIHCAIGTVDGKVLVYDWRNVRKPILTWNVSDGDSPLKKRSNVLHQVQFQNAKITGHTNGSLQNSQDLSVSNRAVDNRKDRDILSPSNTNLISNSAGYQKTTPQRIIASELPSFSAPIVLDGSIDIKNNLPKAPVNMQGDGLKPRDGDGSVAFRNHGLDEQVAMKSEVTIDSNSISNIHKNPLAQSQPQLASSNVIYNKYIPRDQPTHVIDAKASADRDGNNHLYDGMYESSISSNSNPKMSRGLDSMQSLMRNDHSGIFSSPQTSKSPRKDEIVNSTPMVPQKIPIETSSKSEVFNQTEPRKTPAVKAFPISIDKTSAAIINGKDGHSDVQRIKSDEVIKSSQPTPKLRNNSEMVSYTKSDTKLDNTRSRHESSDTYTTQKFSIMNEDVTTHPSSRNISMKDWQESLDQLRYDFHCELQIIIKEQARQFQLAKEDTLVIVKHLSDQIADLLQANKELRSENDKLRGLY